MSNLNQHTTLDLLRHGQLETPGVFCADAKAPLSKEGMNNLFRATEKGTWDIIISSPQHRCREFAEQLATQKRCKLVIDEQFKEMDFGDWVGMKSDQLWKENKDLYQQLWQTPDNFVAPNGESMQSFYQRVKVRLKYVLKEYENQSILLITHGGVIRTILSHTLEMSTLSVLKFNIDYAQMSRLHCYTDDYFSLQFLGKKD